MYISVCETGLNPALTGPPRNRCVRSISGGRGATARQQPCPVNFGPAASGKIIVRTCELMPSAPTTSRRSPVSRH